MAYRTLLLPEDVLQTLEVFVMERKQLLAELTAAAEQETATNTLTPGLTSPVVYVLVLLREENKGFLPEQAVL